MPSRHAGRAGGESTGSLRSHSASSLHRQCSDHVHGERAWGAASMYMPMKPRVAFATTGVPFRNVQAKVRWTLPLQLETVRVGHGSNNERSYAKCACFQHNILRLREVTRAVSIGVRIRYMRVDGSCGIYESAPPYNRAKPMGRTLGLRATPWHCMSTHLA
jgi:hypothetical protein